LDDPYDWHGKIDVTCSSCGEGFRVPKSLKGGVANCPRCGKVTEVPGGPEPLFWMIVALSLLLIVCVSGGCFLIHPTAGIVVFLIGVAILIAVVSAM